MTLNLNSSIKQINVEEFASEKEIAAVALHPSERARFTLAGWVLSISAILMLIAWVIVAYYPTTRLDFQCSVEDIDFCHAQIEKAFQYSTSAATNIFELAKTWIPPVVTLVLGYYFGRGGNSSNDS